MLLYLARHGDAMSGRENKNRPLSEQGRISVDRVASFLARSQLGILGVIHSKKLRSQETALILSKGLGVGNIVQESIFPLEPNDSIFPLYEAIQNANENFGRNQIIVGHLPYLEKLTGLLICRDQNQPVVKFDPGTVIALSRTSIEDTWSLDWIVKPRLFGRD